MTDEARLQRWLNGQRRSHQRTFQSRELVWQSFESWAREQNVAIDQLIAEAMETYASARGYNIADDPAPEPDRWASPAMHERDDDRDDVDDFEERDPLDETRDAPGLSPLDRSYMPPVPPAAPSPRPEGIRNRTNPFAGDAAGWDDDNDLARTELRQARQRPQRPTNLEEIKEPGDESRTSPRYGRTGPNPLPTSPAPIPAAVSRPVPTPAFGSSALNRGMRPLAPPGRSQAPAVPADRATPQQPVPPPQKRLSDSGSNQHGVAPPPAGRRLTDSGSNPGIAKRLILQHRGDTVEVTKDRFLLGRSKTQADMRLDDPNVSRQHAVIERVGSAYYIVDLGSTNGVYVQGERVARRALVDGDQITITSHEIRCVLR